MGSLPLAPPGKAIYMYMYIYIYVSVCVYMYIYMCVYMCVHIYVYIYKVSLFGCFGSQLHPAGSLVVAQELHSCGVWT